MRKQILQQQLKTREIELEGQLPTIKLEAAKCHMVLRKPCIYDVEDLIHEGVVAFFSAYKNYDNTKSASFSTFFHRILINHLNSILIKSYGRPYDKDKTLPPLVSTSDDLVLNKTQKRFNSPESICNLIAKINGINILTIKYIVFCINISEKAQKQIVENPRLKFEAIRDHFNISWREDFRIRKEIMQLLEK